MALFDLCLLMAVIPTTQQVNHSIRSVRSWYAIIGTYEIQFVIFPCLFQSEHHTSTRFEKKNAFIRLHLLSRNLIPSLLTSLLIRLGVSQGVHMLSGKWPQKAAKVRTSLFSLWAIFFHLFVQFKAFSPIILHPISCQKKKNTFKNINSALLKVCLRALYGGAIQCACWRFLNLGHQNHFSILLFSKRFLWVSVRVCLCSTMLVAKQNQLLSGSSSKVHELSDELN